MGVCMYGYAFRRALRHWADTWHGGRGRAPEVWGQLFRSDRTKGQKSSKGQIALEMPYNYQIR